MSTGIKRFGVVADAVVTPTITAGAYSANDAVGGLLTFTGLFKTAYAGGIQLALTLTDKAQQNAAMNLALFNQTFTATADNAAFDVSDADLLNVIGIIKLFATDYVSFNDNSVGFAVTTIPMVSVTASGTIFGQMYTTDTPTYVSTSDIQVRLAALTDVW